MTTVKYAVALLVGLSLGTSAIGAGLTSADRLYLKTNKIDASGLIPPQLNGLHKVINDPKTLGDAQARYKAVHTWNTGNFFCAMNGDTPDCKTYCAYHPDCVMDQAERDRIRNLLEQDRAAH
jgi:hypothetical protein